MAAKKHNTAALLAKLSKTPEGQQKIRQAIEAQESTNKPFTAEMVAGEYPQQLAYLKSTSRYLVACCSRQAGKTWANVSLLILTALATSQVNCIYIGLSERQVKKTAWKTFKKQQAQYNIACTWTEDMVVTFPNGSTIYFESLDDERHIETLLGDNLASGICIIDECQSANSSLITAVERKIVPALDSTTKERPIPGRLVWSGTFPDDPIGRFYEIYTDKSLTSYERHNWNRFDNPHFTAQLENLRSELARQNIAESEPWIQREYFGRPDYGDVGRTAYGFVRGKNEYDPAIAPWDVSELLPFRVTAALPPEGCDTLIVGEDPAGTSDRYAITCWAFGAHSNKVYQVFEAVTDKGIDAQSQADAVLVFLSKHYPGIYSYVWDYGSAKILNDSLQREHGITRQPAEKAERRARVERMRSLLVDGRAFVMRNSKLAEDFALARWDPDKRLRGKWEWSSNHHPDVGDSAVVAIGKYFDHTEHQNPKEHFIEYMDRLSREQQQQPEVQYGYTMGDSNPYDDTYGGGFTPLPHQ